MSLKAEKEIADAQAVGRSIEDVIQDARAKAKHMQTSHHNDFTSKQPEVMKVAAIARVELSECQRMIAMLEVLAVNYAKTKKLDEARRMAQEAAEKARACMMAQKAREREQLDATRLALAAARMERKRNFEDLG